MIPETVKQSIRDFIKQQHPTIHDPKLMDAIAADGGLTKSSDVFKVPGQIIVDALQERRESGASHKNVEAYTQELLEYFQTEVSS